MPGRGPAPKGSRSRSRDQQVRETVKSDGLVGGFDLPEGLLFNAKTGEPEEWHPATVAWWEVWRHSPQSTRMVTDADWSFLLDTALMHHQMWKTGRFELSGEVRLRVAKFGATPEDRARLKFDIEVPDYSVGAEGNEGNVAQLDARRNRWTG